MAKARDVRSAATLVVLAAFALSAADPTVGTAGSGATEVGERQAETYQTTWVPTTGPTTDESESWLTTATSTATSGGTTATATAVPVTATPTTADAGSHSTATRTTVIATTSFETVERGASTATPPATGTSDGSDPSPMDDQSSDQPRTEDGSPPSSDESDETPADSVYSTATEVLRTDDGEAETTSGLDTTTDSEDTTTDAQDDAPDLRNEASQPGFTAVSGVAALVAGLLLAHRRV